MDDRDECQFGSESTDEQKKISAGRLTPIDRTADGGFLDQATGVVLATFSGYGSGEPGEFSSGTIPASATKISRCHILTSAHLIYRDGAVPTDGTANIKIVFHSGQTCDPNNHYRHPSAEGKLIFSMTKKDIDFECIEPNKEGGCAGRKFFGDSDLIIVKLAKGSYDPSDRRFFSLNVTDHRLRTKALRIDCWGYPSYNDMLKRKGLMKHLSDALLWGQKDARLFPLGKMEFDKGNPTNVTAYPGMSGGGCATPEHPRELVGVLANGNSGSGHSAVFVKPGEEVQRDVNYLSTFSRLASRFTADRMASNITVSALANLDEECD